jgi:hypothetical protein
MWLVVCVVGCCTYAQQSIDREALIFSCFLCVLLLTAMSLAISSVWAVIDCYLARSLARFSAGFGAKVLQEEVPEGFVGDRCTAPAEWASRTAGSTHMQYIRGVCCFSQLL